MDFTKNTDETNDLSSKRQLKNPAHRNCVVGV